MEPLMLFTFSLPCRDMRWDVESVALSAERGAWRRELREAKLDLSRPRVDEVSVGEDRHLFLELRHPLLDFSPAAQKTHTPSRYPPSHSAVHFLSYRHG